MAVGMGGFPFNPGQGGAGVQQMNGGAQQHPTVPYGEGIPGQGGFSGQQHIPASQQPGFGAYGGQSAYGNGGYGQQPMQVGMQGQSGYATQQGGWGNQGGFQPQQQFQQGGMGVQGMGPGYGQPQTGVQGMGSGFTSPRTVQITDDVILDGPNVPPELRGRPFGMVRQLYTGLTQHFLNSQGGGQQSLGAGQQAVGGTGYQQPGAQGGQPQQQGGQQPAGSAQGVSAAQFLSNPTQVLDQMLDAKLQQYMGPLQQQSFQQGVRDAYAQASTAIPDFRALEPLIIAKVAGLPPEARTNLAVWQNAANMARGEAVANGTYQVAMNSLQTAQRQGGVQAEVPQWNGQNRVGAQVNGMPQPMLAFGNGGGAAGWQPAHNYPFMPVFSESPTGPGYHEMGSGMLTPAQRDAARKFSMSDEQYMAWLGGIQK